MRHRGKASKRDANEPEIVLVFRSMGATVQKLNETGCPDLLIGFRGRNRLVEVKDGGKPPSERQLTEDQAEWIDNWNGEVRVVDQIAR